MGRMPRSVAVSITDDVSIFVSFDNLYCFGDGEVEPFAVSRWSVDFAVCHLKVDLLF